MIKRSGAILLTLLLLTAAIAKAQFTKAELQVSGLSCALCAKATEKSLKNLPYITDIKPDLMRNIFVITFKDNSAVNFDEIGKRVREAGFFVNSLKVTFNFDNVKVVNNSFSYAGNTYQVMNADNKPLSGPVAVTLVDKGFATRSVYKKYPGQTAAAEPANGGRVYRVAI
jgi:copper chaperone CopZ